MEGINHTGGDLLYVELQIRVLKEIFKQSILATCQKRNDPWFNEVCIRLRVYKVISDLHAVDAGYHADYMSGFIGARTVRMAQNFKEISKLMTKHSRHCSPMLEYSKALPDCVTLFLCNICTLHMFCIKYIMYNIIIRSNGPTLQ